MLVIEKFSEEIKKIDEKPKQYQCELYGLLFNTDECDNLSCNECCKKIVFKLIEEYKEPIKLSKIEYDILESCTDESLCMMAHPFERVTFLNKMKQKDYFKGVDDTAMSIKEILENCRVVD